MKNVVIALMVLVQTFYVNLVLADLPIHVEIKDLVGKWKILKTEFSPNLTTCGSSQPNNNLENIKIKNYKEYLLQNNYKFVSELELFLSDDFVLYSDIFDTTGNEHRANWKVLAVYNKDMVIIGAWTTICDEGFELRIGDETYTAIMHYEPSGKCSNLKIDDATDSNGESECYVTNTNKNRLGWVDILTNDNEQLHACFYAEKHSIQNDMSDYGSVDIELYNDAELSELQNSNMILNNTNITLNNNLTDLLENVDKPTYSRVHHKVVNKNSEIYWHKKKKK